MHASVGRFGHLTESGMDGGLDRSIYLSLSFRNLSQPGGEKEGGKFKKRKAKFR